MKTLILTLATLISMNASAELLQAGPIETVYLWTYDNIVNRGGSVTVDEAGGELLRREKRGKVVETGAPCTLTLSIMKPKAAVAGMIRFELRGPSFAGWTDLTFNVPVAKSVEAREAVIVNSESVRVSNALKTDGEVTTTNLQLRRDLDGEVYKASVTSGTNQLICEF